MLLLSPRIIILAALGGAVVMAFAGFQLGQPCGHPQVTLPTDWKTQAPGGAAKTVPTGTDIESMHQPETALATTTVPTPRGDAPGFKLNDANLTPQRNQSLPEFMKEPDVRKHPIHPLSHTPKWPLILKLAESAENNIPVLPPQQQAAIQKLQEQFVKDVGGTNQNPADPAYASRWLQATLRADDLLRTQIGWEAFNTYSLAVSHNTTDQR